MSSESKNQKYPVDILDFSRGTEKILRSLDGSPAKSEPKKLFLKTHPPHPEEFLCRWGVLVHEGAEMLPSEEYIGSHSEFPSFRD